MLYKKNTAQTLDEKLFRNPTAEYRGAPFWAWNCKLEKQELLRQLEILKKMGFGGGHIHVRSGMDTPYLSEEYLELIKACIQKAKQENLLTWLYDEDRWPSGAAGGLVTGEKQYRLRYLLFTPVPYGEGQLGTAHENSSMVAFRTENGSLLARYDIQLDGEGYLLSARRLAQGEQPQAECWYAYLEQQPESGWFNNQTYANNLDKETVDRFIGTTYESYNRTVAGEFGENILSIFTDEPQFTHKTTLQYATDKKDVTLPWTDDLPETFAAAYGEDLMAAIPELIWERADKKPSVARYHYHDHICQRFTQAFTDNCGSWCRDHNLALTGHMMEEPTLFSQTSVLGEVMRPYRSMDLPGIDMLCSRKEYTTAKQAQSAVHQFGYEGMLSELYGVTNWDYDFRSHKLNGDWQAALGVTVRVPHLSWVSMAGEAKRDFPASINYQSPWWQQYSRVEDHFARVNTALTRGKPIVRVGVIHPVESYWLHWGPAQQTALVRDELDRNFLNVTEWLLFGGIDFDFISESLLPEQCAAGSAPLQVGRMAYDMVIVPGCETLRSTTLDRLEGFAAAGGKLVFAGAVPTLENAAASPRAAALAAKCLQIPLSRGALLQAAESARTVEVRNQTGSYTENLLYQLRQDGEARWLFLAPGTEPYNKDVSLSQQLRIRVEGRWKARVWNTLTGETEGIEQSITGSWTQLQCRLYDYDSLLVQLLPAEEVAVPDALPCRPNGDGQQKQLHDALPYTLSEPNALLLDQAQWALDDGPWHCREEILRVDTACRTALGWPLRKMKAFAQPWAVPQEPLTHTVHLRWHFVTEIPLTDARLVIEDAERVTLRCNGKAIENTVTGWYADRALKTVALPGLPAGENIIEADIPFGKRSNLEWSYLIGSFGVRVSGRAATVTALPEQLTFGDITCQGLPFFGGNITYHIPVCTEGGVLTLRSSQYRGVLQTAALDGGEELGVIYPPYTVNLGRPAAGQHTVDLTLYGHRRNGFGPVHKTDLCDPGIGPNAWRTAGEGWSYGYLLCQEGILTEPVLTESRD